MFDNSGRNPIDSLSSGTFMTNKKGKDQSILKENSSFKGSIKTTPNKELKTNRTHTAEINMAAGLRSDKGFKY